MSTISQTHQPNKLSIIIYRKPPKPTLRLKRHMQLRLKTTRKSCVFAKLTLQVGQERVLPSLKPVHCVQRTSRQIWRCSSDTTPALQISAHLVLIRQALYSVCADPHRKHISSHGRSDTHDGLRHDLLKFGRHFAGFVVLKGLLARFVDSSQQSFSARQSRNARCVSKKNW